MHVNLVYFFIVFSVRDGTETKYPSIVFLSIYRFAANCDGIVVENWT